MKGRKKIRIGEKEEELKDKKKKEKWKKGGKGKQERIEYLFSVAPMFFPYRFHCFS